MACPVDLRYLVPSSHLDMFTNIDAITPDHPELYTALVALLCSRRIALLASVLPATSEQVDPRLP